MRKRGRPPAPESLRRYVSFRTLQPRGSVRVHRPGRRRAPRGSRIFAATVQEAPRIGGVPGSRGVGAAITTGDDQGHRF